jgi:hypothetical protein
MDVPLISFCFETKLEKPYRKLEKSNSARLPMEEEILLAAGFLIAAN